MTREELIKIYSAYLPYDLQIEFKRNIYPAKTEIQTLNLKNFDLWLNPVKRNSFEIKPILYDLSYLTKEIEHEGKKFIPIVELAKLSTGERDCGVTNSNLGTCYVHAKHEKKGFFIFHPEGYFIWQVGKNAEPLIVKNQLKLFQKLLEWHFNIFQIPETEFINKATLNK